MALARVTAVALAAALATGFSGVPDAGAVVGRAPLVEAAAARPAPTRTVVTPEVWQFRHSSPRFESGRGRSHRRPRSRRVRAVLQAARSALGTPYRYGGDSRRSGFDCSGLTRWAWQHGGDSLPHNSEQQYRVVRHIRRANLRPGDLLFFYSPISHVALYVGHGYMIEAPHTGARVRRVHVYWQYYTAAGRTR